MEGEEEGEGREEEEERERVEGGFDSNLVNLQRISKTRPIWKYMDRKYHHRCEKMDRKYVDKEEEEKKEKKKT